MDDERNECGTRRSESGSPFAVQCVVALGLVAIASGCASQGEGGFLWGRYWKRHDRSEFELFPFFSYANYGPIDSEQPGRYGKAFTCLLAARYSHLSFVRPQGRSELVKTYVLKHGLWPLWRYSSLHTPEKGVRHVDGSVLIILCQYESRTQKPDNRPGPWRDYKRISTLWRFFRYERSTDGGRKLDVLFLPVVRK